MKTVHANAVDSVTTAYHEFLTHYQKKQSVYAFVEGKTDIPLYETFIERLLPSSTKVHIIKVGNKAKVLQLLNDERLRKYPNTQVCFFVDRDLSELTGEGLAFADNLYVTDGYSIENDMVNAETFVKILRHFADLSLTEASQTQVKELFSTAFEEFCNQMIPLMAWIACTRVAQKNVNLDNIKLNSLFDFSRRKLQSKRLFDARFFADLENQHQAGMVDVSTRKLFEEKLLANQNYRRFTRGKYVVWFLIRLYEYIVKNLSEAFDNPPKLGKQRVAPSEQNLYLLVAGRVPMPASFTEFINRTFVVWLDTAPTA
jgi:hypothetical protein